MKLPEKPSWSSPSLAAAVAVCLVAASAAPRLAAAGELAFADESTVRLTTIGRSSGKPREVTIWFVADGELVYLQSGEDGKTDWYRNLIENPRVTLEFSETELEGIAAPVEDPELVDHIHANFREKYWLSRLASWLGVDFGAGRVVHVRPLPPPE